MSARGAYEIRGNEIWIEVTPEMLSALINDERIRIVLQGKLYFVVRLSLPGGSAPAAARFNPQDLVRVALGGGGGS